MYNMFFPIIVHAWIRQPALMVMIPRFLFSLYIFTFYFFSGQTPILSMFFSWKKTCAISAIFIAFPLGGDPSVLIWFITTINYFDMGVPSMGKIDGL